MATSEVLPIVVTGNDQTASMWASVKRGAGDTKSAVDQLREGMSSLGEGSAQGLSKVSGVISYLKNPYVALAVAVGAVAVASVDASQKMLKLGSAADDIGVSASAIDGLGRRLKSVGGDTDTAISGLQNLRTQLDLSKRDGGYLEDLFKLNKNSLYDAAGALRPIQDIYRDLTSLIGNAENKTEALEIATKAFGSDAAPILLKAIKDGKAELDAFAQTSLDPLIKQTQQLGKELDAAINRAGQGTDGIWGKIQWRLASMANEAKGLFLSAFGGKEGAEAYRSYQTKRDGGYDGSDQQGFMLEQYGPDAPTPPKTRTPSNRKPESSARNDYDRALNSIGKHISLMEADAAAVGATAGQHEKLRVEAQLLDAAQRAGIEITGKRIEQFRQLGERAKAAADNLAFLKLQNELLFDRAQMGRSDSEQAVYSKLRSAGVDAESAQGQYLAQQIRINEALKDTQDLAKDALQGIRADLRAGKSEAEAFANALNRIADKLMDKGINAVLNSITGGFSGSFSSLFGGSSGELAGWGTSSFIGPTMHSGGIAGKEATELRYINPADWNGAPKYHDGLMPDEFRAILQKGEGVFTEGHMAAMGSMMSGGSGGRSIGDIYVTVPEGTSPTDAGAIGEAVRNAVLPLVDDRIAYHSRARGSLNSGF
jgi:hypothetical protein